MDWTKNVGRKLGARFRLDRNTELKAVTSIEFITYEDLLIKW